MLEKVLLKLETDFLADKMEDVTPIDFSLRCLYMHLFATKDSLGTESKKDDKNFFPGIGLSRV